MTNKTLTIDGKASLKVKPDTTNITLTMKMVLATYQEALSNSAEASDRIKRCLVNLGFKRDEIKTKSFKIDVEYESYRDKNDNYKKRFIGYSYNQTIGFSFLNDNELLSKIFYDLGILDIGMEIKLFYTSSKVDEYLNEALKEACKNASMKANTIASALNVHLGNVIDIRYHDKEEISDEYQKDYLMNDCIAMPRAASFDIEPDDISLDDTISIVYEII